MEKNALYISAYNEVFLNTRSSGSTIFDINHIYGALGYQAGPGLRFEAGMMWQSINNPVFSRSQLQLVVFNNLPFQ